VGVSAERAVHVRDEYHGRRRWRTVAGGGCDSVGERGDVRRGDLGCLQLRADGGKAVCASGKSVDMVSEDEQVKRVSAAGGWCRPMRPGTAVVADTLVDGAGTAVKKRSKVAAVRCADAESFAATEAQHIGKRTGRGGGGVPQIGGAKHAGARWIIREGGARSELDQLCVWRRRLQSGGVGQDRSLGVAKDGAKVGASGALASMGRGHDAVPWLRIPSSVRTSARL
jgi:hypothetical protein